MHIGVLDTAIRNRRVTAVVACLGLTKSDAQFLTHSKSMVISIFLSISVLLDIAFAPVSDLSFEYQTAVSMPKFFDSIPDNLRDWVGLFPCASS